LRGKSDAIGFHDNPADAPNAKNPKQLLILKRLQTKLEDNE
jgi:hypothetical protein